MMQSSCYSFHLFNGVRQLVSSVFEKEYERFNRKHSIYKSMGWTEEVINKGLFIDLSQVIWVEIGAVVQLVLLIESASKKNIQICVALPNDNFTLKEIELSEESNVSPHVQFENTRMLREEARKYLRNIHFEKALLCPHIKNKSIKITNNFKLDSATPGIIDSIEFEDFTPLIEKQIKYRRDGNYNFLIPLNWIDINDIQNLDSLDKILSGKDRGMDDIDVRAIKNVILSELIKNVKEHANTDYALIGGGLQVTTAIKPEYYSACEKNYFNWCISNNSYYISLFFGDSGKGLIHTLENSYREEHKGKEFSDRDVLKWSFNKWSTSKKYETIRGTKGIYRIQRIVNKYNGLTTIRTSNLLGGFQKGGKENSQWVNSENKLGILPGTLIRMQLTPNRELLKLNLINNKKDGEAKDHQYKWITKVLEISSVNPEDTFSKDPSLKNIFKDPLVNILFIVDHTKFAIESKTKQTEAIQRHLEYLSKERHPTGVVIYGFPTGWDSIETIIDSINSMIDKKMELKNSDTEAINPDTEQVYDPVLVLGDKEQYSWVGGTAPIIKCLNEFYRSGLKWNTLRELPSFKDFREKEQLEVTRFFNTDNAIVSLKPDISFRVKFKDIISFYESRLSSSIKKRTSSQSKDTFFITPNLKNVQYWINLDEIINKDIIGYAFALSYLLKKSLGHALPDDLVKYKILIDSHQVIKLAYGFATWVGILPRNIINLNDEIDGRVPRRNPIFDKNDKVIILTSLISSSETVKRSVKAILRDIANPIAILSIINQSKDINDTISVWKNNVKLLSLMKNINPEYKQRNKLEPIYINPSTFKAEPENEREKNKIKAEEGIYNLIKITDALHLGHIGKANNRHFTFFLNTNRLFENKEKCQSLIFDKFNSEIKTWLEAIKEKKFEIWRPSPSLKISKPVAKITEAIEKKFSSANIDELECIKISEIKRTLKFGEWTFLENNETDTTQKCSTLVIIDWGCITGATIEQMILLAANKGYKKIMICILFSQLIPANESFLTNLKQVKGFCTKREGSENIKKTKHQPDMFLSELESSDMHEEQQKEVICSNITVKFLYHFPLKSYETANCPICEHIEALREFEIRGELMNDFYHMRRDRLKIKDKDTTNSVPQDFYKKEGVYLNSSLILEMFRFKTLLQEALTSTRKRKKVEMFIQKISDNFEDIKTDPCSNLYAILYFLSVEIMWVQKPPLVFQFIRDILSKLALKIALWDRVSMKNDFDGDEAIIRTKFSAISVLRSSDKDEFINNIDGIFKSAKMGEHYSRSLTQNLFYHIYSFLKRDYHISSEFFDVISAKLEIIQNIAKENTEIVYVSRFLGFLSEIRKIDNQLPLTNRELFNNYKKVVIENHGEEGGHNNIWAEFEHIIPLLYESDIKNYHEGKLSLESFKEKLKQPGFINWHKDIDRRWSVSASYINNIMNHLRKFKKNGMFNSILFRREDDFLMETSKFLDDGIVFGGTDEFTVLLDRIRKNSNLLGEKTFFSMFRNLYDKYSNNYLFSHNDNIHSSCPVLKIAQQIPSSLKERLEFIIEKTKQRSKNNISIDFQVEIIPSSKIFFPINLLNHFLDQVFSYNLFSHHIEGENIKVTISFPNIANKDDIEIEIINTGTQPKQDHRGELNKIKDEFPIYDGSLEYSFNKIQKQFKLNAKFKTWRYE